MTRRSSKSKFRSRGFLALERPGYSPWTVSIVLSTRDLERVAAHILGSQTLCAFGWEGETSKPDLEHAWCGFDCLDSSLRSGVAGSMSVRLHDGARLRAFVTLPRRAG